MVSTLSSRRRHPLAAFVVMSLGLLVVGLAFAALSPSDQAAASPATASSTQIEEGRALYLVGCSSCHGLQAEGDIGGPSLVGVGAAAVDFQVSTGRMPMAQQEAQAPEKPRLYDEAEVQALAAYIASLGPGPEIPTEEQLDVSDADLLLGNKLFAANCASCHNFAGSGGQLTDGKYAPPLHDVDAKTIWEAMQTGPQSMPAFGDGTLPEEDKQAIISYVLSLQETPDLGGAGIGRIGPVSEGLYGWLLGMGALLAVSIWIGVKAR
jgi:ubiquinol-cytochrome c reductase cytochrome c subunit